MIKLKVGHYYFNRKKQFKGPVEKNTNEWLHIFPFATDHLTYKEDGAYANYHYESMFDLICEATKLHVLFFSTSESLKLKAGRATPSNAQDRSET